MAKKKVEAKELGPKPEESPIRILATLVPGAVAILPAKATWEGTYWQAESEHSDRWWTCASRSITEWEPMT